MLHFWTIVPILLLSGTLLHASVAASTPPLMLTAPALTVNVASERVRVGDTQTIHVQLDGPAEQSTLFVLAVTYPNGDSKRSLHSAQGNQATITWSIPLEAGAGSATFRLSMQSCTCGSRSTIPAPPIVDTVIEGDFEVAARF